MIMAAAFVVGPILGGFLTLIDWRLNFFFNVPIGIVTTVWAHLKLKDIAELPKGEKFHSQGSSNDAPHPFLPGAVGL